MHVHIADAACRPASCSHVIADNPLPVPTNMPERKLHGQVVQRAVTVLKIKETNIVCIIERGNSVTYPFCEIMKPFIIQAIMQMIQFTSLAIRLPFVHPTLRGWPYA